jgi:hypothetical protein
MSAYPAAKPPGVQRNDVSRNYGKRGPFSLQKGRWRGGTGRERWATIRCMKNVQRRSARLALAAALAALPNAAPAFEAIDTLPWPSAGSFPAYPRDADRPTDLWIQAGARREDNALRAETGEQSDTVARLGAGIRHEARVIGRQRVRLEARGDYYKYDRLSALDHFAYSLAGNWLWEVGNRLSGTVLLGHDRRQADISETRIERLDLVKSTRIAATAGYLVTPAFRVRGGLAGARSDRSEARQTETRALTGTVGADYVSPLGNAVGLEYRSTNGEAPFSETVAGVGSVNNDYQEHEVSMVATYALGAQLRTGVRLGRTWRDYDQLSGRDFDGTTGRLSVDWLPGNKTILGFEAYREPRSIVDVAASHVLVKGVAFGPRWAATNKLVLSARLVRESRIFEGDPALSTGATLRDEVLHLWRLALGWEPQRFWQVGLAVDRGERESNIAGRDYQYTAVMGNLAYNW